MSKNLEKTSKMTKNIKNWKKPGKYRQKYQKTVKNT